MLSLGNTLECLVHLDSLITADSQWSTVHEAYPCTFTKQHLLDEYDKRNRDLTLQLHESVV